ncbi:MAG: DUF1778 domain-containing protein [Magnetococcales bacterium]|nr:DUF1778 domain-containing protein [Magnetococcales bacterium]
MRGPAMLPPRGETLNLRMGSEEKNLIDRAARAGGQNRTDFNPEAARRVAEETLLDRTVLTVDAEAYEKWLALLDAPPQTNERLRRALQTPAPWEG